MKKLIWREEGHLSEADAGYALCGAPVRFTDELPSVPQDLACDACVLRAESGPWEFTRPTR